jgi:hypothetical protein
VINLRQLFSDDGDRNSFRNVGILLRNDVNSAHIDKKLHPKRQKESRKTIEETSGYVRLERAKWPNSLIAT